MSLSYDIYLPFIIIERQENIKYSHDTVDEISLISKNLKLNLCADTSKKY